LAATVIVALDSNLRLSRCLFFSSVTWFHKDKELRDSEIFKIGRSVPQATLTIKNIALTRGGEYTVAATNHYGSKSATCKVQVLGMF